MSQLTVTRMQSVKRGLTLLWLGTFVILSAVFSALVIVVGGVKYTLFLAGLFGSVFLMFVPVQWLLFTLVIYAFLIMGPVQYFTSYDTHWVPFLMGVVLIVRALLEMALGRGKMDPGGRRPGAIPPYAWALLAFFSVAIVSTALGSSSMYSLLISSRNLFFMWGVFFVLAMAAVQPPFFRNAWRVLIVIGLIQLPMTFYQRFYVAAKRVDSASWDAVVGTFAGYKDAGGDSGGMAFFVLAVATVVVALWQRSQLSGRVVLVLLLLLLAPVMLAEVKIVYVLIPVMAMAVFRSNFLRKPLTFVMAVMAAGVLLAGVYTADKSLNVLKGLTSYERSLEGRIESIFGYSTGTNVYLRGGEMGRMTALAFWWDKNRDDLLHLVVGHGLSSSVTASRVELGSEARKYPSLHFDNTAAAVLLWETGVAGLAAFMLILVFGAVSAGRLARVPTIPAFDRALLYAASVIIGSLALLVPYNGNLTGGSPATLVLLMLTLGMVAFWNRQLGRDTAVGNAKQPLR